MREHEAHRSKRPAKLVEDPGLLSGRLEHSYLETWLKWCLAILVVLYVMWWAVGPRHAKVQDQSSVSVAHEIG